MLFHVFFAFCTNFRPQTLLYKHLRTLVQSTENPRCFFTFFVNFSCFESTSLLHRHVWTSGLPYRYYTNVFRIWKMRKPHVFNAFCVFWKQIWDTVMRQAFEFGSLLKCAWPSFFTNNTWHYRANNGRGAPSSSPLVRGESLISSYLILVT